MTRRARAQRRRARRVAEASNDLTDEEWTTCSGSGDLVPTAMLPPPVCSGTACFRYRAGGDTRSATSCRLAAHATPAREIVKSLLGCVADALTSGLSSLAGLKYFRNFASLSEPRSLTCGHRLAAGWSYPAADGFRDYKSTIIAATTTTVTNAVTPMTSHKVAN